MVGMDRCSMCPGVNDPIPCDGPDKCDIFFIGEAPGIQEQRQKKVFTGKTGQELNEHYLPTSSLRRSGVRIGNAIKCLPPSHRGKLDMGRQKDVELLLCCASKHLYNEIESCYPKLLVP